MATVYLARDPKHDRSIALKVLETDFTSPAAGERFVREIRLIGRLQHPLIVGLLDSGVFAAHAGALAGRPFYTMPYVQGESLRERLVRGAFPLGEATRVLRDVAEALAYAHAERVVHRDVKPGNILLSRGHAVVTDFGIATAITLSQSADRSTGAPAQCGTFTGTPAYMAPEQTVAGGTVDARSDLYSYGVVAYEILAHRHPFAERKTTSQLLAAHHSERPSALVEIAAEVPPPLASLVMQLLEKSASDRPPNAEEVLRVLDTISMSDGKVSAPQSPPDITRSHPLRRTAVAILLFAAVGTSAYVGVTWGAHSRPADSTLRTNNAAARELYSQGRQFWQQRTPESMRTAARYFQLAIAADSSFANAYSGLADVYVISPLFEVASPLELFPLAKKAAQHALALDGRLAEAHASLARVLAQYDGDQVAAERELQRALAIEPANAIMHQRYAQLLWWRGRHEQAFSEIDTALALDSLSRVNNLARGTLLSLARRPDDAIAQLQHTLQLDPEYAQAHASLGIAYLTEGRAPDAIAELETARRFNASSYTACLLAYAYAASGQRARARAILRSQLARARQHYVAPTGFAVAYAGLGDSARAVHWLEQAAEIRDPNLPFALSYSFLDWLRANPSVAALVKRLGAS
jgi:serine/threonine-protein kinase